MRHSVSDPGEKQHVILKISCLHCVSERRLNVFGQDLKAWKEGTHPQNAFPYLDPEQIELLISGLCGDCQNPSQTEDVPEF